MEIMNKEEIRSIIFNAEVMMYGTVEFRIDRNDDEIIIVWAAIADGGAVVSHGEKHIHEKYFIDAVNVLVEVMSVAEDDETGNVCWELQVLTNTNEELFCQEAGYWENKSVDRLIKVVQEAIDDEVLKEFNNLLFG